MVETGVLFFFYELFLKLLLKMSCENVKLIAKYFRNIFISSECAIIDFIRQDRVHCTIFYSEIGSDLFDFTCDFRVYDLRSFS
jgi:hypothetical protein